MKLRIRGDSIRLRLKRSEVDTLASGASIVEQTRFPGSVLTYRLDVSDDDDIAASFDAGSLAIRLPQSAVTEWAGTDEISLIGEPGELFILVEKDFQCLSPGHHRPAADDDDTYPHPEADTGNGC